jgi:Na+/H+ antiporter NhaD/arsenite permease-like protein
MFAGFVIFRDLPLVALAGGAAALVAARRPPAEAFRRVDWPLLVFFAGLFVVVHGVERAGLLALAFERVEPLLLGGTPAGRLTALSALSVLFSNVFSNVPFVMVAGPLVERLPEARLGWLVLAMSSTLAGNLTIVGSVANMIVLEQARDAVHVGFGRFFRIGLPVTLLTTLIGTAMLIACLRWLG